MSKRNGYTCVYNPSHHRADSTGMVYEHMIIAEYAIGRELKPEESVHHEYKNRSNNTKDNLYVFATSGDHTRYHNTGVKTMREDGIWISPLVIRFCKCKNCGNEFIKKDSDAKYCSHGCHDLSRRKADRPTKEHLLNILLEFKNFTKVGIKFNVSDNAIRKWCKAYGLSTKVSDYKV